MSEITKDKLEELTNDLLNEIYLYCEEHNIKPELVSKDPEAGSIQLQLDKSIPKEHIDQIEAIVERFAEEHGLT